MVVVGCPCDFCAIVSRLREEADDLNDGRHGDGAGVEVDGAWWLLGGASVEAAVGDHTVLLVVVWRPGSERCWDLSRSHRSGTQSAGTLDANGVRMSVGFGLGQLETWLVGAADMNDVDISATVWVYRHREVVVSALGRQLGYGLLGVGALVGLVSLWVNWHRGVGWAGESWLRTASSRRSVFVWQ